MTTKRATELRKAPVARIPNGAIALKTASDDGPADMLRIPLDLAPLLAPFKRKGRLIFRVERMPGGSRLSAGRNNGDKSWSLTLDELEDLEYLLPEDAAEAHTLGLRIVSHDGTAASTLAVIDVPITPATDEDEQDETADPEAAHETSVSANDDKELRKWREELAKSAAVLAARESELAEALSRADRAEAEIILKESALSDARTAQIVDSEARMAQARESWRREMRDALTKAETNWKAGEADRLAAAKKQWQAHASKLLADARTGTDTLRKESETELRRLQEELENARSAAAERDAELKRTQSDVEATRQREQDLKSALANAEAVWKTDTAARLEAAQAEWSEQSARMAAELTARCERAEKALTETHAQIRAAADADTSKIDLREARTALAVAEADIAARERELVEAREATETLRRREQEWKTTFAQAESAWKSDTAARIEAARSEWREQSLRTAAELAERCERAERALAEANAQMKAAAEADTSKSDLREVRNALAATQAILAAREQDLAEARGTIEAAELREEELAAALPKAEADWKAQADARVKRAESEWRAEADRIAAELRARCERAERELIDAQMTAAAQSDTSDSELRGIRNTLAATQSTLAAREKDLAGARETIEATRQREREMKTALSNAETQWKTEAVRRLADAEAKWREESERKSAEWTARFQRAEAALADARAQIKAPAKPDAIAAQLREARDALAAAHADLSARERDLAEARKTIDALHRFEQEEIEAAVSKAEAEWQAGEADRLSNAEGRWQSEYGSDLAEARARYEAAEWALADVRKRENEQGGPSGDRLRNELATLRAVLEARESELARLRVAFGYDDQEPARPEEVEEESYIGRRLVRDIAVVVGLVVTLAFFYPNIVAMLPYEWQTYLPSFGTENGDYVAPEKPAPAAAPPVQLATAEIVRDVNLRTGPSTNTDVIATLPRGASVELIRQQGDWSLVRMRDKNDASKDRQGWAFNRWIKANGPIPGNPAAAQSR